MLVASVLVWCGLTLHAQTPPAILTPPASQAVLVGSNAAFSVAAGETGPFTYQWQFNGANLPNNNLISTLAGNGAAGSAGDGGAATNASLSYPFGVTFDAIGNLYVADFGNSRIRKVGLNGIISTVAGQSIFGGYSGDGGPAINANLYLPSGVAWDASNNLYIADQYNHRIRKVDANGIISTVAGTGNATFAGDGGAATNASLAWPWCVAFDASGNMYIADSYNNRVRRVSTGGIITTVAGNGSTSYLVGDGGLASNASLNNPEDVAFDAVGNLYIADTYNNRVRKVSTNGIITTVAGNGTYGYSTGGGAATNATLAWPEGIALDASGNLYFGEFGNNRVRMVNTDGNITTVAGNGIAGFSGDGSPGTNAALNRPVGVALDAAGNLYLADAGNNRIREVYFAGGPPMLTLTNVSASNAGSYAVVITSPYGSVTSAVATLTVEAPPVITVQPTSQTNLAGTNAIFTVTAGGTGPFSYQWQCNGANFANNNITISTVAGNGNATYTGDGEAATNASLYNPKGLALDAAGNLYRGCYKFR